MTLLPLPTSPATTPPLPAAPDHPEGTPRLPALCGTASSECPATPPPPASAVPRRLRPAARHAVSLLPVLYLGVWAAVDWHAVRDGTARLAGADPWWLLAGLVFTYLGSVAAACVRQGAVPDRLPPGPLVASQIAAGAANHVLPASIGAHAVTVRFLQRQGVPLPRATASIALYSLVRAVAKTPVVLAFLLLAPTAVRPAALVPDGRTLLGAVAGLLLVPAGAAVVLALVRAVRGPVMEFVRTALTDARHLHTRPGRFLPLWGGAAAAPLIQASVVASVGKALDLPLSWPQLLFAFLAASTAAGAVPAPGGIGPVDAALILTLAGYGTPLALATATVIGYRTLTVWLPLLPGMLVLSAMVQRKLL
ncbi:lysylphosphatidylglycerol synthase transmembrane domain-containing protein [Streptomyces sp. NPDC005811]|uniref:lysylphosphatidylglycerol synthase transmembrane domain-containing protein n=1 Tax=Streptomyces sp. NPDC005811 TaxID=3154565 RepID=UPI0033D36D66